MSYYTWQLDVEVRRRNLIADHYNWRQHRLLATHFRSHLADFFTQPAYDRGIYRFDNFPMASAEAALNAPADTSDLRPLPLTLTTHQKDIDYFGHPQTVAQFRLDNGDLPPVQSGAGEGAYLVLKSSKNVTYLLPTWPIREGRKKFLTSGRLFKEGFSAEFYNENFKKGDYRVGVLTADRHGNQLYYTNNVLRLDSLTAVLNP
ncbi:MAG: hypothetical protein MUE30_19920 [Spirosomaceae bacterium]|nr:hypothetical protein [Spirosomataceae bacterium]